jgi:hypothetical protein
MGFTAVMLAACSVNSGVDRSLDLKDTPAKELVLAIGQQETVNGVTLTFVRVAEDSRCPSDVTCVWEGNGAAEIQLTRGSGPTVTRTLNTTGSRGPSTIEWEGLRISLLALTPTPISTQPIPSAAYRLTLRLGGVNLAPAQ